MKRIAIFCDGTWNTPDEMENGKPCQTNVVKMANALSQFSNDGIPQFLYYHPGVGSEGRMARRVFDGATGTGISANILNAYHYVINTYEPGDELFLFGFSRGAFTVRSLAGLIRNSGILKTENIDQVKRAFNIYRSRHPMYQPREIESTLFRKTYAIEEVTQIKFIGVWDTVGALGNPLLLKGIASKKNQFHDTELSTKISYAFHALAIDEKRKNFEAALWHQQSGNKNQVLEQVWFAGVHSDVGGGYTEKGLSDIALEWMMDKAKSCQLKFDDIKLNPVAMASKHESYTGFYKLQSPFNRPMDVEVPGSGKTNEFIHPLVVERYKKDSHYRPKNLVDYFRRHPLT
jgi:uncharacterized protein (DUF2235 family)